MAKKPRVKRTDTEIRQLLLQFFYNRNHKATSARSDKTGAAAKISVVRRELKALHGLEAAEVRSNLTYLISQGYIEEEQVTKSVPLKSGAIVPQATSYYRITAAGIDKIDGPGEFTPDPFHGIKVEATGQNIITVGDHNRVNVKWEGPATLLSELRDAIVNSSEVAEGAKLDAVADIESIQAQLAKSTPSRELISGLWEGVKRVATAAGLAASVTTIGAALLP